MLIDNWLDQQFTLERREGDKFFFECPNGHKFSIWKARLNVPRCSKCFKQENKNKKLNKKIHFLKNKGWEYISTERQKVTVKCLKGHVIAINLYRLHSCSACKIDALFQKDVVDMKQLASNYNLQIDAVIRKNPRNTSLIKVICQYGHLRTYTFSEFRYLDVECMGCELAQAKKLNKHISD